MEKLPVLISIPHGGNEVPPELGQRLAIGSKEIFEDSDAYTREIYDLGEKAMYVVKTTIARAFVDPSRSESDRPPEDPDGIIKSHTCFGKIIYKPGLEPKKSEIESLLKKYYYAYHHQLQRIINTNRRDIQICLDCHSMAETGPVISPDSGSKRPLFCPGNRFGEAASDAMIRKLRSSFINAFELDETDVAMNQPFAGGFITRTYGNRPLPWVQVEMNRKFYLRDPYFDSAALTVSSKITEDLNSKFYVALKDFFSS
jgi:N-formylglutamate deformylase